MAAHARFVGFGRWIWSGSFQLFFFIGKCAVSLLARGRERKSGFVSERAHERPVASWAVLVFLLYREQVSLNPVIFIFHFLFFCHPEMVCLYRDIKTVMRGCAEAQPGWTLAPRRVLECFKQSRLILLIFRLGVEVDGGGCKVIACPFHQSLSNGPCALPQSADWSYRVKRSAEDTPLRWTRARNRTPGEERAV